MQLARLPILALGIILIVACGTAVPPNPTPKHIRQSTRHLNMAAALFIKGCYFKALTHYQQAHERYTAADQLEGVAHSLNGMANVYYRLNELPSAARAYDEAIAAYALVKSPSGRVRSKCNKAAVLISAARLAEAETLLDQADQIAGTDNIHPALRHKTRAMLMMQWRSEKPAKALLHKAIKAAKAHESDQLSSTYYTLGRLLLSEQLPSQATVFIENALSLDQAAGAYNDIAHDLALLGECHVQLGQWQQAADYFKRSVKIFALLGNAAKVQGLVSQLESLGSESDMDIQSTLHWVTQWLAGHKEANLCR